MASLTSLLLPLTPVPPTLYVLNASSIAKPHAAEQLSAELIGYNVDIGVISETHLKKKHADSCVSINGYLLFRRDRIGRKCGGVAVYVLQSPAATVWSDVDLDSVYELLWVKVVHNNEITFVGAIYHPPKPIYQTSDLLDHIEEAVLRIQQDFPGSHVILAGDLNTMPDSEVIIRTGLKSLVTQPTRGYSYLDRVYVSDQEYDDIKVVHSAVKNDRRAVVCYTGTKRRSHQD